MNELFEAAYYSHPVPRSLASLTLLALVFDKLHFPGVYIPESGIDEVETRKEIDRIKKLGIREADDVVLLNSMEWVLQAKHLRDFFIFTGKYGHPGTLQPGAEELAKELEELIYGPPPPNFFPIFHLGFSKDLPGDKEASVNGPSWLTYPANALVYSANHGLVLVNDNPGMPVPSLGGATAKDNAKVLAAVLSIESVRIALPNLKPLVPAEIAELRYDTRDYAKPFRLAMLKLTKELNAAITAEASFADIRKHSQFIAQTTVLPELEELRAFLDQPSKSRYRRAVEFVKSLPELVTNFYQMDPLSASGQVLMKLAEILANIHEDQGEKKQVKKKSGYYYLLKIQDQV